MALWGGQAQAQGSSPRHSLFRTAFVHMPYFQPCLLFTCPHPYFYFGQDLASPSPPRLSFSVGASEQHPRKDILQLFPSDILAKREYLMIPHSREGWSTESRSKWTQGAIPTFPHRISCSQTSGSAHQREQRLFWNGHAGTELHFPVGHRVRALLVWKSLHLTCSCSLGLGTAGGF